MDFPGLASAARHLRLRQSLRLKELGNVSLRPISPKDEPLLVIFHQALTEETVYKRYFQHISLESRIKHERLLRICTNSDETFALVAATKTAVLAIGRLSRAENPRDAEFALLVNDKAQGRGLGSSLMKAMMKLARACGFQRLTGEVLVANSEMLYVCRQFGFTLHTVTDEGLVEVKLDL